MLDSLVGWADWGPIGQATLATTVNWLLTAVGAAGVFAVRTVSEKWLRIMLGFAAGVMLAASYWSLLAPSIELASEQGKLPWLAPLIGFVAGSTVLLLANRVLLQLRPRAALETNRRSSDRTTLLILAITLHNLPEGLAVGVAFGAVAAPGSGATLAAAIGLSIGIGIQNIPEGMAISLPMRSDGKSRLRSFMYGQLSGVVEVAGGILGAAAVLAVSEVLPYALAFSAGAMILVTLKELIPESMASREHQNQSAMAVIVGFGLMMVLDVGLS